MAMNTPEWVVLCRSDFRKYMSDTLLKKQPESLISYLMGKDTATTETVIDATMSGLGDPQVFTGTANLDRMTEEYSRTIEFPEYTKTVDVRKKLWDDQKKKVLNVAAEMAIAFWRGRERRAAFIYNNAFAAGVTYGDGQPLCSAVHPSRADAGYAGNNLMAVALTPGNVETMRQRMATFTDGRGNFVESDMDMLLVGLALEEVAWEIINTGKQVNTANNNSNFHEGRYKLAVWKYLNDPTAWFGIDQMKSKMYTEWLTREGFSMEDEYTAKIRTLSFTGAERTGVAVNSWRHICGSRV